MTLCVFSVQGNYLRFDQVLSTHFQAFRHQKRFVRSNFSAHKITKKITKILGLLFFNGHIS